MTTTTRQRIKYILGDLLSSAVACLLFNIVRYHYLSLHGGFHSLESFLLCAAVVRGQLLFPLVLMSMFALSGYYNRVFFKSRLEEFFTTFITTGIASLLYFFVALVNDVSIFEITYYRLLLYLFLIFFGCIYAMRLFLTVRLARRIQSRKFNFAALILGVGEEAVQLTREIKAQRRSLGFNIVGYIAVDDSPVQIENTLPIYRIEDLEKENPAPYISTFIVALNKAKRTQLHTYTDRLSRYNLPIKLRAEEYETFSTHSRISDMNGICLVDYGTLPMSDFEFNIKYVFDRVFSLVGLLLSSPLLLLAAVSIRREGAGGILFKQERIGRLGKPFTLYKLRTMRLDAEQEGPALSSSHDNRITPVGRFLRKYRLDELPQLWNVVRGDMSLVGYRPERKYYIDQIVKSAPQYYHLLRIRPGITSFGMVKYGYARSIPEMILRMKYDLHYLENMSLLTDTKILIYTVKTVLSGEGI